MDNSQNGARQPPTRGSLISAADIARKIHLEKRIIKRKIAALEEKREGYLQRWKEIRRYELPFLGEFEGLDEETNRADRKDRNIWNLCAWQSNQVFAAGVMSGLTPPSRRWFRLNFASPELVDNSDLGKILDQRIDIMNDVLEKSNFYESVHSCYMELAFGQAPLAIFPDSMHGVHFVPYTVGTYYLENGANGNIETFARKYKMSAVNLIEKFGEENVPWKIRREAENSAGVKEQHTVIWYVAKNDKRNVTSLAGYDLPYISVYYVEGSDEDEYLYIGGFYEFPVLVARYHLTGGATYGKGPGWYAEGDSKALQLLESDLLRMVELTVKPPMMASAESAAKGINLVPGGKTIVQQNGGVGPLFQVGGNLDHLRATISEYEQRIKRQYSADLFMMFDQMQDKTMTAREVLERNQEKMTILGPVVQRMQFEFLGKIIERVYNILDRARVFPAPEDEEVAAMLASEEIRIEYISPLAQAQKMSGLVNIEQAVAFVGQIAQFDPNILQKMDFSETVNKYFSLVGAPADIKRTDDEYKEILQGIQEKQAQAEQMAQAQAMANMAAPAAQAAKNVTEAARDGNPALQELMSSMSGMNA